MGAPQGGRRRRGRRRARRLPGGAARRRAPGVAADPAGRGRAVAPTRQRRDRRPLRFAAARHPPRRRPRNEGTFVEIKNSEIGEGAKVPHLAYVGDAEIGPRANVGAGNVANYDGKQKHPHEITLRAPTRARARTRCWSRVEVGEDLHRRRRVTHDVPPGALAKGVHVNEEEGWGRRSARLPTATTKMATAATKKARTDGDGLEEEAHALAGQGNEELSAEIAECLHTPLGDVKLSTLRAASSTRVTARASAAPTCSSCRATANRSTTASCSSC